MKKLFALTPKDLVDPLPIKCDFGIICYIPDIPQILEQYKINVLPGTYFSHSKNYYFGEFQDHIFVVVGPIYGCPHATTVIEDMKFHKIENVIGLGYVGVLSSKIPIGTNVIANSSLMEYPLYYNPPIIPVNRIVYAPDEKSNSIPKHLTTVRVWTTNGIYFESEDEIDRAISHDCQVVNMESSGFIAVTESKKIGNSYYVATVSDPVSCDYVSEKNELANVISGKGFVLDKQRELVEQLLQFETMDIYINDLARILKNVCSSHGLQHSQNVMNNAKQALKVETKLTQSQRQAVLLAALLHDADDHKFFPNNRNYENARFVLRNKSSDFVDLVIEMISLVSCSQNGDSLIPEEYKLIPRYADRLEALGLTGIKRSFVYSKTIGLPLILKETPRPHSMSELTNIANYERFANYNGKSKSMIDHYYDKLLHLGNVMIHNTWIIENIQKQMEIMRIFVLEFCHRNNHLDDFVLDFITKNSK
jgi:uncharacterized protein